MRTLSLSFLLLAACSHGRQGGGPGKPGPYAQSYSYRDVSGEFEYAREVKLDGSKLVSRTQILNPTASAEKLLEKTVAVASFGSVQAKGARVPAVRPLLAQHTVWLEGKQYFSQQKLNLKTRKLEVVMQSPEAKWNGRRVVSLPKGNIFCFYSQLPECLQLTGLPTDTRRRSFVLLWDSWPYHGEQLSGLSEAVFLSATVAREGGRNDFRYVVEAGGQTINLHFSKTGRFIRMFWTAQGISIQPSGEVQDSQEL